MLFTDENQVRSRSIFGKFQLFRGALLNQFLSLDQQGRGEIEREGFLFWILLGEFIIFCKENLGITSERLLGTQEQNFPDSLYISQLSSRRFKCSSLVVILFLGKIKYLYRGLTIFSSKYFAKLLNIFSFFFFPVLLYHLSVIPITFFICQMKELRKHS